MNISKHEIKTEQIALRKFNQRLKLLRLSYKLNHIQNQDVLLKAIIRRSYKDTNLSNDYKTICSELNFTHKLETNRTEAEKCFLEQFKEDWKINIYSQVWIANFCIDYFIPSLGVLKPDYARGYTFKGIAIEIDGGIHNNELKMKKDNYKTRSIENLGLLVLRYTNEQVSSRNTWPSKSKIYKEFGKLCSRERNRIWKKIHLTTILYHGDPAMVSHYFHPTIGTKGRKTA